jgi:hypothetical protein
MGTPYQESYGDYGYSKDEEYLTYDDFEERELDFYRHKYATWYNRETHLWECGCPAYRVSRVCRHVHRFRGQETIKVKEEYL